MNSDVNTDEVLKDVSILRHHQETVFSTSILAVDLPVMTRTQKVIYH